jgi:site-specific recombinase XerD
MTREYGCQGRNDGNDQCEEAGTGFEAVVPNPKLKLMDQVREVMRLRHYSLSTERSYCDWIRRYIKFHQMKSRADLDPAEPKIEGFLSDLAVNGNVAVSTQNQAFNGLLFLYQQVLHQKLRNIQAIRATRPQRAPIVLTPEEVKRIIGALAGTPQLVVKLLYGSGLRLMEALRLRVQDVDFEMKQITVRDGKGFKDRYTLPSYHPPAVPFARGSAAPTKPWRSGLRATICDTLPSEASLTL